MYLRLCSRCSQNGSSFDRFGCASQCIDIFDLYAAWYLQYVRVSLRCFLPKVLTPSLHRIHCCIVFCSACLGIFFLHLFRRAGAPLDIESGRSQKGCNFRKELYQGWLNYSREGNSETSQYLSGGVTGPPQNRGVINPLCAIAILRPVDVTNPQRTSSQGARRS